MAEEEAARRGAGGGAGRPYGRDAGRGAAPPGHAPSTRDVLLTVCDGFLLVVFVRELAGRCVVAVVGEVPFRTGTGMPRCVFLAGDCSGGA